MNKVRSVLAGVVVASLLAVIAIPGVALAGNGKGNSEGKGHGKTVAAASNGSDKARSQRSMDRLLLKTNRKNIKAAAKAVRKKARNAHKATLAATASTDTVEPTGTIESTSSVEGTKAVGAGVTNAFDRITRNLQKSLDKIAAGTKKQLPPGLVRVWLKFATWLGVDTSTMPGAVVVPTSTVEPTGTLVPTSTVEPTGTIVTTITLEPTVTVVPTVTPAP